MSDPIKHECGVVLIRLLKPIEYYQQKYGNKFYGLNLLYLIMEKQHNRGQEGAGAACINLGAQAGNEYIFRHRAMGSGAIRELFDSIHKDVDQANANSPVTPFLGEVYLGHLRYSTTGRSGISYVHPFLRRNNWKSRNLCLAGNFNLTNVDEILEDIMTDGQHPRHNADTFIILEQLGALLDSHIDELTAKYKPQSQSGAELNELVEANIDMETIIHEASKSWDGGYAIIGSTGSGDSFIFRDRQGIRPAFYFANDEIVIAASERPVIQTALNVPFKTIKELEPGASLIIKRNGEVKISQTFEPVNPQPCSFERIYFSRGSDREIYQERKTLGRLLTHPILKSVGYDIDNTVFSFIPNTAETAYYGMVEGLEQYLNTLKHEQIVSQKELTPEQLQEILDRKVRIEKLAIKDIKLRTFIAEGNSRNDLAAHVYDVTYGIIRNHQDNIVVIDDSIVRGTTLRQSIIKILSRLNPKKIVIVSSSPQIRYPDCYGIDMSSMSEFIAFNAAIELLKENGQDDVIESVYAKSKAQVGLPKEEVVNYVKEIYAPFNDEQISRKIADLVTPEDCNCEVEVLYQTIEDLHTACPNNPGDWYFSGNYPTPGGNRLVNQAFVNFYEKREQRH
ncbi:MAG: amidophosphoribosyltransferase [Rikenellaceae bacterium]